MMHFILLIMDVQATFEKRQTDVIFLMKSHVQVFTSHSSFVEPSIYDTVAPLCSSRARHHAWHLRGIWGIIVKEKLQSTASDAQKREKTQVDSLLTLWQRLFLDLSWERSPHSTAVRPSSLCQYIIYRPVALAVFFQAQDPSITATTSSYRAMQEDAAGFLI